MKTYLLNTLLVCLFVSLAITFLSIESLGDILIHGVSANIFKTILNSVYLLSEIVILTNFYQFFKGNILTDK